MTDARRGKNMFVLGTLCSIYSFSLDLARAQIAQIFGKKDAKVIATNVRLMEAGFDWAERTLDFKFRIPAQPVAEPQVVVSGNTAIALGVLGVVGGLFAAFYYLARTLDPTALAITLVLIVLFGLLIGAPFLWLIARLTRDRRAEIPPPPAPQILLASAPASAAFAMSESIQGVVTPSARSLRASHSLPRAWAKASKSPWRRHSRISLDERLMICRFLRV